MRPLSLTVEGFTAFKDENKINFDDLQLAVFLGPNGAGKSSLLEAILIALYGMAPRMRSRQIRDYISHGRNQFRVEFEFRLNQETYRVQRQYSRKSAPKVRLEKKEADGWIALTDKVEETNRVIASLLRMGYDTFTKAVLLPQNLFDQFLKGDKEKRREVLDELLNLKLFEKIGALAGEKRRELQETLGQDERLIGELNARVAPEFVLTLKNAEKKHEEALLAFNKEKKDLLENITGLEKTRGILLVYEEKKKRIAALENDQINIKNDFEKSRTELEGLKAKADEVHQRFQSEIPELEKEEQRLVGLSKIAADLERLIAEEKSTLSQLSIREKIRIEVEKNLTLLRRKREEMANALLTHQRVRIDLEKEDERFQLLLEERENLSLFGKRMEEIETIKAQLKKLQSEKITSSQLKIIDELRAVLSPGDFCPVCAQPVVAVPAELEKALATHEAETIAFEKKLRTRLNYPDGDLLLRAREEFSLLKKKSDELKNGRKKEDELNRSLTLFDTQIQKDESAFHRVDREREGLKALLDRLQKEKSFIPEFPKNVDESLAKIRKNLNELRTIRDKTLQQFHQSEERVRQLSLQLEKISEILNDELAERAALEKKMTGTNDISAVEKELKNFKARVASIEDKINFHSTESGKTKQQLHDAADATAKLKTIAERQGTFRKKEIVYGTIHQDLQKNRLPDFLYGNVLETLLIMAGERFLEFSQGRYCFSLQGTGDIQVLDGWNANEPRPVESLSGGETFAASLALALALSDYLQGRQQVECLFIDEGFGNLDLETRNKVAEILGHLRRENKLIGIVTHIEELADYFPHQIIIEKLPEGSRIREESNPEPKRGRISEQVA